MNTRARRRRPRQSLPQRHRDGRDVASHGDGGAAKHEHAGRAYLASAETSERRTRSDTTPATSLSRAATRCRMSPRPHRCGGGRGSWNNHFWATRYREDELSAAGNLPESKPRRRRSSPLDREQRVPDRPGRRRLVHARRHPHSAPRGVAGDAGDARGVQDDSRAGSFTQEPGTRRADGEPHGRRQARGVRNRCSARRRRNGRGLSRARHAARSRRRDQGPLRAARERIPRRWPFRTRSDERRRSSRIRTSSRSSSSAATAAPRSW